MSSEVTEIFAKFSSHIFFLKQNSSRAERKGRRLNPDSGRAFGNFPDNLDSGRRLTLSPSVHPAIDYFLVNPRDCCRAVDDVSSASRRYLSLPLLGKPREGGSRAAGKSTPMLITEKE